MRWGLLGMTVAMMTIANVARADEPADVKLPPSAPPAEPLPPAPAPAGPEPPPPAPPEGEKPDAWHLAAGVGTDFPIAVGARAHVEAPIRLRLSMSIGVLPGPYVDFINSVLTGISAINDQTADLVKSTLGSSLIWRTHVGYRPFRKLGLYFEIGYGLVGLGGTTSAAEVISTLTNLPVPERAENVAGRLQMRVKSTLHMFDVEVGYDIPVAEHFQLRVALGAALTMASSTTMDAQFRSRDLNILNRFEAAGAKYLDDIYTTYVFTPVISVSGHYAFF